MHNWRATAKMSTLQRFALRNQISTRVKTLNNGLMPVLEQYSAVLEALDAASRSARGPSVSFVENIENVKVEEVSRNRADNNASVAAPENEEISHGDSEEEGEDDGKSTVEAGSECGSETPSVGTEVLFSALLGPPGTAVTAEKIEVARSHVRVANRVLKSVDKNMLTLHFAAKMRVSVRNKAKRAEVRAMLAPRNDDRNWGSSSGSIAGDWGDEGEAVSGSGSKLRQRYTPDDLNCLDINHPSSYHISPQVYVANTRLLCREHDREAIQAASSWGLLGKDQLGRQISKL
ncbi:hypothetical protein B0H63DRAFT_316153 [Podospora didyma]|uniref:Uncharacterized protein n=1 Tax=Podospora didyma TaxID=330526 RepID=A0AAE0N4H0_9PEZI|nr:hypothetical protein B0H63DRAFT_316153 [Podospora didyma]